MAVTKISLRQDVLPAVGKALMDMTLVIPLAILIFRIMGAYTINLTHMHFNKISPLGKKRLQEMEVKIQALAKRQDSPNPRNLK